jgi:metallo-beta-lactamase class B
LFNEILNMRYLTRRRVLLILLVLLAPLAVFGFMKWREGGINGGQKYAKPFRIAGNFYYVGANDISSFLITGPEGHVLIDGGYPGTAKMIIASIAELGFDIRDVKVLLNSEPHYDHAGGLAELQKASGARLLASGHSAHVIETGGDDPSNLFPIRLLVWTRIIRYPPAHVDHVLRDGETIRVGPVALTAHVTPGHTRGCTSWAFPVRDGDRVLNVVSACSLVVMAVSKYSGYKADFERSFRLLRSLPADIWVTAHARQWGRYRKFLARDTAKSPVDAFIDPDGYRAYVDSAQAQFRRGVEH